MKRIGLAIGIVMLLVLMGWGIYSLGFGEDRPRRAVDESGQQDALPTGDVQTSSPVTPGETEIAEAPTAIPGVTPPELRDEEPPNSWTREFETDFSRHTVSYDEILSGGPPKDAIPAIDDPQFIGVVEADEWLDPLEPVVFLEVNEDARAYPIQILTWHEIVNDTVGGEPVIVTFCPLCNTAIAFKRSFEGQVLDFGTTGRLRFSNLIMYDRQTESWWQQASGEGIAGLYAGRQLEFLPAQLIAWKDFKNAHPQGMVLSRETGYTRSYGNNPYPGYDNINSSPFLYDGPPPPGQLLPMARVLTIDLNDEAVAYPYEVLQQVRVANDTVGGEPVAVIWKGGAASAFPEDRAGTEYRDVGAANAFSRELDGRELTFRSEDGNIVDEQTGSQWNVIGEAVAGELNGAQLDPVVSVNHFWFSWAAFKPETRIYTEGRTQGARSSHPVLTLNTPPGSLPWKVNQQIDYR